MDCLELIKSWSRGLIHQMHDGTGPKEVSFNGKHSRGIYSGVGKRGCMHTLIWITPLETFSDYLYDAWCRDIPVYQIMETALKPSFASTTCQPYWIPLTPKQHESKFPMDLCDMVLSGTLWWLKESTKLLIESNHLSFNVSIFPWLCLCHGFLLHLLCIWWPQE